MTEMKPTEQFSNEIVELAHSKYELNVNDTIRSCIQVAVSVAAHETKIGEEAKIKEKLLEIIGESFDVALHSVRSENPDIILNQ